jgi:hypothetical protein
MSVSASSRDSFFGQQRQSRPALDGAARHGLDFEVIGLPDNGVGFRENSQRA